MIGAKGGADAAGQGGQRHPDGEPAARGVDRDDRAAHRLGEPLGDGKPEPDAGRPLVEAGERLEDPLLELGRHPGAVVDHVEHHPVAVLPGAQHRPQIGRRVPQRVGEQVGEHPLEQPGIGPDEGQVVGHDDQHLVRVVQAAQRHRGDLVHRGRAQERLKRPGLQAAHVEQVADERVEPVGVLLDVGEQLGLVLGGPAHVGLPQARHARLDRGERRAQVVAHRAQQRGPHPVALRERLRLGCLGAQPGTVKGGDRLGGVAGEQRRRRARRLPADLEGQVRPHLEAQRVSRGSARRSTRP